MLTAGRFRHRHSLAPARTINRQHPRSHRPRLSRSHRLPVVATSEFWWEDEQEFDALTEVLLPKQVVVCTPSACRQHLQQLQPIKFVAAFSDPAVRHEAEQLWDQLGRAGPPLFLKVRTRDALQAQALGTSNSSSSAEQFWQEVSSQSWRMDLDYGLNKDATLQALTEQLLVVVGSDSCAEQLVSVAVPSHLDTLGSTGSSSESPAAGVYVVELTGWNQGEKQEQLQSWRQLKPQVVPLSAASVILAM